MPEISLFYGIRITMYYEDHNPPLFHAEYNGHKALIDINDACVIKGSLPARQLKIILAWCVIHQDELMQNWELSKDGMPLNHIAPLVYKELAAVAAYFSDGVVSDEYTAEIDNRVNVNRQDSRLERDNMRMEEFLWEERYWAGKKAREEGLAEGRDERSQEIAWNLYEAKLPLDMIAKTTKLTMEQVKAVIKKHNVLI